MSTSNKNWVILKHAGKMSDFLVYKIDKGSAPSIVKCSVQM